MREVSDGLPPLRSVIAAHGLGAKKSFGQNFLLDFNLTKKIARAAGPLENTTVYEVGPGPGGLTRALFTEGASRVIAIERDDREAERRPDEGGSQTTAGTSPPAHLTDSGSLSAAGSGPLPGKANERSFPRNR